MYAKTANIPANDRPLTCSVEAAPVVELEFDEDIDPLAMSIPPKPAADLGSAAFWPNAFAAVAYASMVLLPVVLLLLAWSIQSLWCQLTLG